MSPIAHFTYHLNTLNSTTSTGPSELRFSLIRRVGSQSCDASGAPVIGKPRGESLSTAQVHGELAGALDLSVVRIGSTKIGTSLLVLLVTVVGNNMK